VQRTEWNVRDTGGTIILSIEHELTGGFKEDSGICGETQQAVAARSSGQEDAAQALRDFVSDNEIATLNVAGPRASKEPQVGEFVKQILEAAFPA
jgi:hypothetical protein